MRLSSRGNKPRAVHASRISIAERPSVPQDRARPRGVLREAPSNPLPRPPLRTAPISGIPPQPGLRPSALRAKGPSRSADLDVNGYANLAEWLRILARVRWVRRVCPLAGGQRVQEGRVFFHPMLGES